jgi:hypothetical protein
VLRATISEKDFQETVLTLARLRGWKCYHTHDSRRSEAGFPERRWLSIPLLEGVRMNRHKVAVRGGSSTATLPLSIEVAVGSGSLEKWQLKVAVPSSGLCGRCSCPARSKCAHRYAVTQEEVSNAIRHFGNWHSIVEQVVES